MPIQVRPDGPIPARVMIVGEAPGADEEAKGIPFVGASGHELNKMLHEAGLSRSECFVTNVARERPFNNDINNFIAKAKKDRTSAHIALRDKFVTRPLHDGHLLLQKEIEMVKPNIIVALGNTPMWSLTGLWGITKWRGSMLHSDHPLRPKVIPTYHPAAVLRQWDWRAVLVNDLKRAARFRDGSEYPSPAWNFLVKPTYAQAHYALTTLLSHLETTSFRISFDLETRLGHIACAGLSWSLTEALCVPFMCVGKPEGYWTAEEEAALVWLLFQILTHPNAQVVGQNILYDSQYTWRHWHFVPRVVQDCMISQHSIFSALPKSLAFQASMYCNYYVYWKDEGKNWAKDMGETQLWTYNCQDCVYTDECGLTELEMVKSLGLEDVHTFQQKLFWPVLKAMQLGVKIDTKRRDELIAEVMEEVSRREQFMLDILGHPLNPNSPKQMMAFFYEDLKQPVIMTRAKKGVPSRPTLDDEALTKIAVREPFLKPLVNAIADIRTLGKFLSVFLLAPLDVDGRMRCAYNIGGSASGKSAPKTYRLSSSENAFGSGANLQTIPSEKSKSLGKAAARGGIPMLGDPYQFPNIRSMFIPDLGKTWFDMDLDRADLQVVVWESGDELLKLALRLGVDVHLMNVYTLDGKEPPPLEELVETHPKYLDHRGPRKHKREFSKVFCHATDYVGGPRTVAAHTGRTVQEIERAQKVWFSAHPGILKWHERVQTQINKFRFVENRFGYRWYIFDRLDSILPEAVAWIPQSTVSVVINKIWVNIHSNLPNVEVLLQVHDSLAGQIPTSLVPETLPKLKAEAQVVVPYDDPLIIPVGIKTSTQSWGAVV